MKLNGITHNSTSEGNFYAIGLNYKKADAEIRGHFSISEEAKQAILLDAKEAGITSLSVISTCKRRRSARSPRPRAASWSWSTVPMASA
jgi:glutamyl-tRNA reductase